MARTADPIFIVSSERSGSNLLRVLLGNHSQLHAPVAPQFLMNFAPLVPYYGDWNDAETGRRLVGDMTRLAGHEQYAWQVSEPDRNQPFRGWLDCFHWMYAQDAERNGKVRFVCKENKLFDFVAELANYYAQPRFIYLYRDPRAYVASWLQVPLLSQSEYVIARRWSEEQRQCLTAFITFRRPFFAISYERLVADTRSHMESLLRFVGEPWEEACAQTDPQAAQEAARNPYWKNLDKPIDSSKLDEFRRRLTTGQLRLIESVTRHEMRTLGYPLLTTADWKPSRWFFAKDKLVHYWRACKQRWRHRNSIGMLRDRAKLMDQIREQRKAEIGEPLAMGEHH
ncbi:MAG TPA: sulfotransferase [Pirellulaceae bacterium]|nr:sulfotransferase [Pirellulaceae bacterium]